MKNLVLFLLLLTFSVAVSQNEKDEIDKIIDEMCTDFKLNENLKDEIRFEILNQSFIYPYLSQFSEGEQEEKINELFYRFQRQCAHYRAYLIEVRPQESENWIQLFERPEITVTDTQLEFFKNHSQFYYFEYGGDKTQVTKNKNYWIDAFSDGTTSKSFFKWIDKTRFELEFIESSNVGRQNFSKKGDKYIYQIISKESDFFWLLVEIPGQSEMLKFKLFIEE